MSEEKISKKIDVLQCIISHYLQQYMLYIFTAVNKHIN